MAKIGYDTLSLGCQALDYATTPQASDLTGLSINTLREWTSRRAFIPADVRPKSKGSPAQYTWQTILILRLAVSLRTHFRIELQAHKELFASIKKHLRQVPLTRLWGQTLAIYGDNRWELIVAGPPEHLRDAEVLVRLDPHLEVLTASSIFPSFCAEPTQIELFPLRPLAVDGKALGPLPGRHSPSGAATTSRRLALA